MNLPNAIGQLFLSNPSTTFASESFKIAEWRLTGNAVTVPQAKAFQTALGHLPKRDKLRLSVVVESEPVSFVSSKPESIEDFLSECKARTNIAENLSGSVLTITVEKSFHENSVSLYSLSAFIQTLREKTLRERLTIFEEINQSDKQVWVETFASDRPFQTRTFIFGKVPPPELKQINRSEKRGRRNDLCHSDFNSLSFLPDDFRLVVRASDAEINSVFDDLCVCSSLVWLADVSTTQEGAADRVSFKWNGYKSITGQFQTGRRSPTVAESWFSIYDWVYSGGEVSDKVGLARNVMSLHWHGAIDDMAEAGVFTSLRSSYEIYLKQNVERYISIKNKLNEYLAEFAVKAAKLAEGLTDKFEKNVTAFVSFFITSILAKILTDKSFYGMFNRPVAIIGVLIVGGSALHLILTIYLFNKDRKWLADEWGRLQGRYADLLDAADLQRIFDKTKGYEQINTHLNFKRKLFLCVWSGLLIVALSVVLYFADWSKPSARVGNAATQAAPPTK